MKTSQPKSFSEKVYEVVARVPAGRVTTYGAIARMIGQPKKALFVGYASRNRASWHLPWHRVVFKDGSLVPGWEAQQYKELKAEGVKFTRDNPGPRGNCKSRWVGKKVDMEKYLWRPKPDTAPPDIRDWPLVF